MKLLFAVSKVVVSRLVLVACLVGNVLPEAAEAAKVSITVDAKTEGERLTITRKGRRNIQAQLAGTAYAADAIKCSYMHVNPLQFATIMRAVADASASTDIARHGMQRPYTTNNITRTVQATGVPDKGCDIGAQSAPGEVILTLGNAWKLNGRIVSLSSEEAIKLAEFMERNANKVRK
jgi:hypothetical protein